MESINERNLIEQFRKANGYSIYGTYNSQTLSLQKFLIDKNNPGIQYYGKEHGYAQYVIQYPDKSIEWLSIIPKGELCEYDLFGWTKLDSQHKVIIFWHDNRGNPRAKKMCMKNVLRSLVDNTICSNGRIAASRERPYPNDSTYQYILRHGGAFWQKNDSSRIDHSEPSLVSLKDYFGDTVPALRTIQKWCKKSVVKFLDFFPPEYRSVITKLYRPTDSNIKIKSKSDNKSNNNGKTEWNWDHID